jgi:hypothetical protein
MLRLIKADRSTAGKRHLRYQTPQRFLNFRAFNILLRKGNHFRFQIVAREIEFAGTILI